MLYDFTALWHERSYKRLGLLWSFNNDERERTPVTENGTFYYCKLVFRRCLLLAARWNFTGFVNDTRGIGSWIVSYLVCMKVPIFRELFWRKTLTSNISKRYCKIYEIAVRDESFVVTLINYAKSPESILRFEHFGLCKVFFFFLNKVRSLCFTLNACYSAILLNFNLGAVRYIWLCFFFRLMKARVYILHSVVCTRHCCLVIFISECKTHLVAYTFHFSDLMKNMKGKKKNLSVFG